MKTMTVYQARNYFSRALKEAEKDVVIVTRRGRPRDLGRRPRGLPPGAIGNILGHDPPRPEGEECIAREGEEAVPLDVFTPKEIFILVPQAGRGKKGVS